jgi:hypothetical protein
MGLFVYARGANGNERMDGMDEKQLSLMLMLMND